MKSWQIIRHSVRQVTGNLGPALRISLVLYLLGPLASYFLDSQTQMARFAVMQSAFGGGIFPWSAALVPALLSLVAGLWIGVAWHRYVLTGAPPGRFLPRWAGEALPGYVWAIVRASSASLVAGVVLGFGVALVWGVLSFVLGTSGGGAASLAPMLLIVGPLLVWSARLSMVMPAAAIGQKMTLTEAWRSTTGSGWPIFGALVALILMGLGANLPLIWWFAPLTVQALLWQTGVGWVIMMVGLSLLTTLYGHYIQKRDLI